MISQLHLKLTGDILLVDDVPENLMLLFEILSREGHEVRRVLNGQQALNVIQIEPPDLVLLDIKMPLMDGYEVCEQLKSNPKTAHIPIIFLSALNDVFDKAKAFAVGGVDYITKPFDTYEVLMRVDNQLKMLKTTTTLTQQNQELALLNRDLEAFNYMVSHDLRRPLTQLLGFIHFLIEDSLPPEKKQEALEIIFNAGQEMNQIITDLMRLAKLRQESLRLESVNLSAIAQAIIQKLILQEPERPVDIAIAPDLMATGDKKLLKLALENLIENAWKYSSTKNLTKIEFFRSDEGTFCLRDYGVGFDPAEASRIFEPFQRLHSYDEFSGTGIGLAIVHRIITSHHGRIWYEGAINQGASFLFALNSP
ncbi:MAG: response regulator [Synechococcaceae cyanobacterium RL_1_2]|nr:response regulator [Synechococcaceae cyanobacterium RL_1_2]